MSQSLAQKLILTLFILILTSICFTNSSTSNPKRIEGIFNVISGDTISLDGVIYKLDGITAPTPPSKVQERIPALALWRSS